MLQAIGQDILQALTLTVDHTQYDRNAITDVYTCTNKEKKRNKERKKREKQTKPKQITLQTSIHKKMQQPKRPYNYLYGRTEMFVQPQRKPTYTNNLNLKAQPFT
eukprot:GHVL01007593.1.p1 GENE.GHVL01007593.1~~GHVL01007593.1.p1  ORF type:complete len:105 (+),score=13.55 GHVL01007593.1:114-428(+)